MDLDDRIAIEHVESWTSHSMGARYYKPWEACQCRNLLNQPRYVYFMLRCLRRESGSRNVRVDKSTFVHVHVASLG
jgi:hypothetical protein